MALDFINANKTQLILKEDNEACIEIVKKGYSYELRHVAKTQGIDMSFLHECFYDGPLADQCKIIYENTDHQVADAFTKALTVAAFTYLIFRLGIREHKIGKSP